MRNLLKRLLRDKAGGKHPASSPVSATEQSSGDEQEPEKVPMTKQDQVEFVKSLLSSPVACIAVHEKIDYSGYNGLPGHGHVFIRRRDDDCGPAVSFYWYSDSIYVGLYAASGGYSWQPHGINHIAGFTLRSDDAWKLLPEIADFLRRLHESEKQTPRVDGTLNLAPFDAFLSRINNYT